MGIIPGHGAPRVDTGVTKPHPTLQSEETKPSSVVQSLLGKPLDQIGAPPPTVPAPALATSHSQTPTRTAPLPALAPSPSHSQTPTRTAPARVSAPGAKPSSDFRGKQQQAIDFFTSKGWSLHQAQAIVANLSAESALDETLPGDQGAAYGLAQWRDSRRSKFQEVMGKPIEGSSFEDQLAYVDWELRHTEKSAAQKLSQTKTYEEATEVVAQHYERPGAFSIKATPDQRSRELRRRIGQLASPVPSIASNRNAVPVRNRPMRTCSTYRVAPVASRCARYPRSTTSR